MKSIRITEKDHAELVRRKEATGVSIAFQVSQMIAKSTEGASDGKRQDARPQYSNK